MRVDINIKAFTLAELHGCKNITCKKLDGSIQICTSVVGFCGTCGSAQESSMTQLHLTEGTIIIPLVRKTVTNNRVEIDIDTNGYKGPNKWGKDVFHLF